MSDESPQEFSRRAAALRPTLYPELEMETYDAFIKRIVVETGYSLEGVTSGHGLRLGDRAARTSYAAVERLFLFSLWSKGVCYGNGKTSEPRMMADAIGAFVVARASIDQMEMRFPCIEFSRFARPHEEGRLVDECWRWRLESGDEVAVLLAPLLRACASRTTLRALFPFTSHATLNFSRTTGYPYDAMPSCARPVYAEAAKGKPFAESFVPDLYEVFVRGSEPIEASEPGLRSVGKGGAEWAADTLERDVPDGWGAAVDGTIEDSVSR